ncbi:hypothetical protein ABMD26_004191 [Pseudomonas sp. PvP001]
MDVPAAQGVLTFLVRVLQTVVSKCQRRGPRLGCCVSTGAPRIPPTRLAPLLQRNAWTVRPVCRADPVAAAQAASGVPSGPCSSGASRVRCAERAV